MKQEPINEFDQYFQERLLNHSYDPPMHLWDRIDQKRNTRYKLLLQLKRRWPLFVMAFMMLSVWLQDDFIALEREIKSLPIPLQADFSTDLKQVEKSTSPVHGAEDVSSVMTTTEISEPKAALNLVEGQINSSKGQIEQTNATNDLDPNERLEKGEFNLNKLNRARISDLNKNTTPQLTDAVETKEGIDDQSEVTTSLFYSSERDVFPSIHSLKWSELKGMTPSESLIPIPSIQPVLNPTSELIFGIEVIGGAFKSFRTLEAFSEEFFEYLELRNETEEVKVGYGAGAFFFVKTPNNIRLRTGFNIARINERFEYFNPSEEQIDVQFTRDPNTGLLRADTSRFVGPRSVTANNRLTIYDIPLLIGYEKSIGKINVGINAGAFLNIALAHKGEVLSPDNFQPIEFSSQSNDEDAIAIFRNRVGVSWFGSLHMAYPINRHTAILLEPNIRYFPSYFNQPDYVLNQKYLNVGISAGLRYTLF